MTPPSHTPAPAGRVLSQPMFLDRIEEELSRCLRTRNHVSVVVLTMKAPAGSGPDTLTIAEDLTRHIRRYDLVAVTDVAEVMLLFPLAARENADLILARLRGVTASLRAPRSWGVATWPADGADPAALLRTARSRQVSV